MLYLSAFPKAFASSNLSYPPLHQHALRFACPGLPLAKDGVTTFLIVDPMDDLGVPSTPEVQQFRAGNGKTCILTSCCLHWEAAYDLLIHVGQYGRDGAYRHSISFTLSFRPLPLTEEDSPRGSPVTIQTQFGTLSARLRTPPSAQRQHARVGTGRNMPGTPGRCLSTLNYATSCRTPIHPFTYSPIHPLFFFFPLLVAASIAASRCRFSLPFCNTNSTCSTIVNGE